MPREDVEAGLRKFLMNKMIEFLQSKEFQQVVDALEKTETSIEFNFKLEIPIETISALKQKSVAVNRKEVWIEHYLKTTSFDRGEIEKRMEDKRLYWHENEPPPATPEVR